LGLGDAIGEIPDIVHAAEPKAILKRDACGVGHTPERRPRNQIERIDLGMIFREYDAQFVALHFRETCIGAGNDILAVFAAVAQTSREKGPYPPCVQGHRPDLHHAGQRDLCRSRSKKSSRPTA
jgi:hypothetical protein